MEDWKFVVGYPNYQVSNLGRIKRVNCNRFKGERILKPWIQTNYLYVSLSDGKVTKNLRLHRLVALTFCANNDQLPEVDHINRNKLDNRAENLRWVSRLDQMKNRDDWDISTNTGEHYITYHNKDNKYQVAIQRKENQFYKSCDSLEEAIRVRDSYLNQI